MGIVGRKISLESTGIIPPYYRFSVTSQDQLTGVTMVGYTKIPAYFLAEYQSISIDTFDISQSPNIEEIGDYAFYNSSGRMDNKRYFFTIPDTVKKIGNYGIRGRESTYSVLADTDTLPPVLEYVGDNAFQTVTRLTCSEFPSSLKHIGEYAFDGCTGLTLSSLPSGLEYIGDYAFQGCTGLTLSTIPSSVTTFGTTVGSIFYGCTSITHFTLPEGITWFPYACFYGCTSLLDIDLPSTLNNIDNMTLNGCSALTTITCRAATPPRMSSSKGFGTVSNLAHIYVPSASVDAYKTKTNWTKYASKISAIPT